MRFSDAARENRLFLDNQGGGMLDRVGGGFKDYAPLILRLGLAIIFILQGALAVPDLGKSPSAETVITMVIQLLGGLFCLIGFLTRWAAFALGALMLWQIIDHHGFYVFYKSSHQLPLALFMMCAALYGLGGGKYSLDEKQKKKDG
jgi:uncharacterized membrane protein YphA (DoxX/SURF4 family)